MVGERSKFIEKSKIKHGDKFDYSLVEYKTMKIKIKIICKKHDFIFEQTPCKHLESKTGGCKNCNSIGKGRLSNIDFIQKSILMHGDEYLYNLTDYIKSNSKVLIKCKIHGYFSITPNSHLNGRGCQKCGKNNQYTIEDLNLIFNKIFNDKYEYDFTGYKNIKSKIVVECKKHSNFETSAELLMKGYGCSSCGKISVGEERISKYLTSNGIEYIKQKSFDGCVYQNKMQFDFYIPSRNICIEYDGKQHFGPIEYFGGDKAYNDQVKKDNIKDEFCKSENIKLVRIPYYKYDNIDKILEEQL